MIARKTLRMPNRFPFPAAAGLTVLMFLMMLAIDPRRALGAAPPPEPPPALREFRAAWVATVNNIDWPSKQGLTTQQQQAEVIAILDRAAALKMNAIVFQVRDAADALYDSKLEP